MAKAGIINLVGEKDNFKEFYAAMTSSSHLLKHDLGLTSTQSMVLNEEAKMMLNISRDYFLKPTKGSNQEEKSDI